MEITLPISSLFMIAIGSIGVTVSISMCIALLIKKRTADISNIILALLLLLSGLTILNEVLTSSGITNRFKDLYFIPIYYSLSIAPLFFLFIKSRYYQRVSKLDAFHLFFPVIQAIIYLFVGFQSIEFKSQLWASSSFKTYLLLEQILFPLGLIGYSFLSTNILRKPLNKDYFWNTDLKQWLLSMTKSFIALAILECIVLLAEYFFAYQFAGVFYVFRISIFTGFIIWIAYNIIKLLFPLSIYKTKPNKQQTTNISEQETNKIKTAIQKLMKEDHIYINPDLNLEILSSYIGTSQKKCSQILRTEFDNNFNQFINTYRIEAFKKMIDEGKHKHFTLLSLAYDSGFESKSTFNRSFKQLTGLSPSQYIKSIEK